MLRVLQHHRCVISTLKTLNCPPRSRAAGKGPFFVRGVLQRKKAEPSRNIWAYSSTLFLSPPLSESPVNSVAKSQRHRHTPP